MKVLAPARKTPRCLGKSAVSQPVFVVNAAQAKSRANAEAAAPVAAPAAATAAVAADDEAAAKAKLAMALQANPPSATTVQPATRLDDAGRRRAPARRRLRATARGGFAPRASSPWPRATSPAPVSISNARPTPATSGLSQGARRNL